MVISRRNEPSIINCHLNHNAIVPVTSHKHIGLTFSNDATWDHHINIKYKTDRAALLTLYKTFIRSKLEYADIVSSEFKYTLQQKKLCLVKIAIFFQQGGL
jgi:hypothetical protein